MFMSVTPYFLCVPIDHSGPMTGLWIASSTETSNEQKEAEILSLAVCTCGEGPGCRRWLLAATSSAADAATAAESPLLPAVLAPPQCRSGPATRT